VKEKMCRCDKDDNGTWHGECTCNKTLWMSGERFMDLAKQEDGCEVAVWSNWQFGDEGSILRELLMKQSRRMVKLEKALKAFADADNWFDCYCGGYAFQVRPIPGWRGPMEDNPEKFAQSALEWKEEVDNDETNDQEKNQQSITD